MSITWRPDGELHKDTNGIMITTLSRGHALTEWCLGLRSAELLSMRKHHFGVITGLPVGDARNSAVAIAIEQEMEYLFFWDDDMFPRHPGHFARLMNDIIQRPDITAISGVYPRRATVPLPIVCKEAGGGGMTWDWEDGELHKVFMAGTGFMVLRVADMRTLGDRLPTYKFEKKGDLEVELPEWFREDHRQTDDVWLGWQLKDNDMQWHVDGSVVCDQRDMDGRVYRVEDAKVAQAVPA